MTALPPLRPHDPLVCGLCDPDTGWTNCPGCLDEQERPLQLLHQQLIRACEYSEQAIQTLQRSRTEPNRQRAWREREMALEQYRAISHGFSSLLHLLLRHTLQRDPQSLAGWLGEALLPALPALQVAMKGWVAEVVKDTLVVELPAAVRLLTRGED